ncbi:cysteine dioxygenase 1, partial [Biomphalaria glabrata]
LQELIWALNEKLREDPDADIGDLLTTSRIDFDDCVSYAFVRESIGCNRNLIFDEPDLFRLTLNVWRPAAQNGMHDHGQSKCYFKVLCGKLVEIHYHVADINYREGQVRPII